MLSYWVTSSWLLPDWVAHPFAKFYAATPSSSLHCDCLAEPVLLTPVPNLCPVDSPHVLGQLSVLSDFTWSLHFLCWTLTSYARLLCPMLNSHILHWFYSRLHMFIHNSHLPMVSMTYCELTFILAKGLGQILALTIIQPKLMWLAYSVKNKFN